MSDCHDIAGWKSRYYISVSLSLFPSPSLSLRLSPSPQLSPVDVVEKVTPDSPVNLGPESEGQRTASIIVATQVTGESHGHSTLHGHATSMKLR